jgi:putative ABC transport system permease protein
VRIEGREFRVVGVMGRWRPSVRFYDITSDFLSPVESVFMPFNFVRPMKIQNTGNTDGWGPSPSVPGFEGRFVSESCWIQMWVELPDAERRAAYEDFLQAYVMEQKRAGRFPRPVNNRVTRWWRGCASSRSSPAATAMMVVSLLFLLVLAEPDGAAARQVPGRAEMRARALGARRIDVFVQHLVECELVGVVGGAIGLGLSVAGLVFLNRWAALVTTRTDLFRLDLSMTLLALGLSLLAGLVAGAYPAWRVCRIPPALHLKIQ